METSLINDFDKLLKKASKEDVADAIADAKDARERATNSTNSSASKANRATMNLPAIVVHWITIKYGKDIWRNKKFIKELWETYSIFRSCERY
jgi:hypothetical protein